MWRLLIFTVITSVTGDVDYGDALFLTPYINFEDFDSAKELAAVQHPDMDSSLSGYSGYLTVNETSNSNLFFWYFPAITDPSTAPVMLWLNGGPGMSSVLSLLAENGPYYVTENVTLAPREYAWNKYYHMIYVDSPVGTGFSFGDDDGYARNALDVGLNMYEALNQFFKLFSELRSNPFYVSGESYAGKYVPAVAHVIHEKNQIESSEPKINLVGLVISNGITDPGNQLNYADYFYGVGLIDMDGRHQYENIQLATKKLIDTQNFQAAAVTFDKIMNLRGKPTLFEALTGSIPMVNIVEPMKFLKDAILTIKFINETTTRDAIHVGNVPFEFFSSILKVYAFMVNDFMASVAHWMTELLSHYKVLILNGQMDGIIPHVTTENYLSRLKFSGDEEFRSAKRQTWTVDGELAGWIKTGGNLTQVLVRNAGHTLPHDQPKWVIDITQRWTNNKVLDGADKGAFNLLSLLFPK